MLAVPGRATVPGTTDARRERREPAIEDRIVDAMQSGCPLAAQIGSDQLNSTHPGRERQPLLTLNRIASNAPSLRHKQAGRRTSTSSGMRRNKLIRCMSPIMPFRVFLGVKQSERALEKSRG